MEEGLNKGAYCHQFFVKGRKELLTKLSRQKVKDSETRKSNQENQQSPHKSEMLCPTTLYRGRSSGIPAIIAAIECSEAALSGVLDSGSAMNQITSKDMSWRQNAAENCSDWIIEVLERESRRIKSYKVHRCVLALGPRRSEYFARLFEKPDSTTKSVFELSSAEAQVFPMVLDHMYTDSQLEFDSSTAYALYFLGDQLEITSILLSVTEFYSRSMTNENIIDFLTVAMSFRDTMLLDAALDRCAGGLHYMDQTTASKIKPVVFLEVLRRSKALSNSYKLDSNRLSQLVAACMEGNRADLTLDLFFSLVDEKYLPTIESCAAIQILAVQNELACHSYGVAEMISNSLQVRCVTSIVNDWRTVKEKLVKDITLATQMEAMPSTVLFKILMTTTGSCDTKAC